MSSSRRKDDEDHWRHARLELPPLAAWLPVILVLCLGTYYWLYWTPRPLPSDAELQRFSEERALGHVQVLSDFIGFRQVSTDGLHVAARYLEKKCDDLAQKANERSDLAATVHVEQVTGAIVDQIFKMRMINVYRGLTNVVLFVGPKDALNRPAVLINAHYDSALGSPGAADCGSCVGVGLEVVRALIESDFSFPCPIVLLLNGGEETLLQAAHGFMQQSIWKDRIGAFINLESTGSGGMPLLFQFTGSWVLQAYAKAAPFPRGIVLAQEFFESGVIPADTDFRMFSKDHHGKYPGVDIATVLDATSYHTNRDTVDRIRRGTTQEYGEGVLALTKKMTEMLADHDDDGANQKTVYSDVFHTFMLRYSIGVAKWLHWTPFLILLTCSANIYNVRRFLLIAFVAIWQHLMAAMLTVLMPALFGALRVFLTGRPMVWFSHHFAAAAFFWPAALAGFLLPNHPTFTQIHISARFFGISFVLSCLTVVLTMMEIGSSFIPFLLALTTAVASTLAANSYDLPFIVILGLSFVSSIPCTSTMVVMAKHVMQKIGLSGAGRSSFSYLIPDAVVGALNGFVILPIVTSVSPLLTIHWTPSFKKGVLRVLLTGCVIAGAVSSLIFPYSLRHPKRVFLNHVCRQHEDFGCQYVWSVGSSDAIQIDAALPPELQSQRSVPPGPIDWVSLAPFDRIVQAVAFEAPPFGETGPWGSTYPRLIMVQQTVDSAKGTRRLEFELRWEKPGWGAMNLTGPVTNWSLSDPSGIQAHQNSIRFAQDAVDPVWPFWIEMKPEDRLMVQIGVYYPTPSTHTENMTAAFPEWTSVVAGTSFVYQNTYP